MVLVMSRVTLIIIAIIAAIIALMKTALYLRWYHLHGQALCDLDLLCCLACFGRGLHDLHCRHGNRRCHGIHMEASCKTSGGIVDI